MGSRALSEQVVAPRQRISVSPTVDGGTTVIVEKAVACAGCKRMALVFVNRAGRTRCTDCDAKVVAAEKVKP